MKQACIRTARESGNTASTARCLPCLRIRFPVEKGRENLKRTLEAKEDYAQCSVAMAYYLFRALQKAGLYEETDREWDLWRNMVKKNLTTCVEDGVNERSDCHAWGALALYELPAVVLGSPSGKTRI